MPRALVTGSAGFVGRHMVSELLRRDYDVVSCDIRSFTTGFTQRHNFYQCNAIDFLRHERREYDLVVHCAYLVGGRAAIDGSRTNLTNNLTLDTTLFDWALRYPPQRLIYFSSSAAYPISLQERGTTRQLREQYIDLDRVFQPDADYGWAKLTGERLARNAQRLGLPVTVLRPFSGHGADQALDYPFPTFMQRIHDGVNPFPIWGDATQRRDWIHIDDVVSGALAIAEAGISDPVNLCTGVATSMRELAHQMARLAGVDPPYITVLPDKPFGVHTRVGDPTRMLEYYQPKVTLTESIQRALSPLSQKVTIDE